MTTPQIFYCHGLPGSAAEISGFMGDSTPPIQTLGPLDFAAFNAAMLTGNPTDGSDTAHVIGFSLGAMTALKLASHRPESVKKLTLIAPAAPLALGNFLPDMAGRSVFELASKGAWRFAAFSMLQRLGVAIAPDLILKTMFVGSPDADLDLLNDPEFRQNLLDGLKLSLGRHRREYTRAVREYVQPWEEDLQRIECSVTIHYGTSDNWAPAEMSVALGKHISSGVKFVSHENLGHYSTLHAAFPTLLNA